MTSHPLAFARRDDRRLLTGVAGGFADQHGIDVTVVRGALVVLSFAGGLGIALYALGAVVALPPGDRPPASSHAARRAPDQQRNASVVCMAAGLTVVVRSTGLWIGDTAMVAISAVVAGVVVLSLLRGNVDDPASARSAPSSGSPSPLADVLAGRHAWTRLVLGALSIAGGLILVGAFGGVSGSVQVGVFATALTVLGLALVLGPWLTGLVQTVSAERRARIRSEEREAMAAHLHDSVLQTLALIQRSADDPRRTVTLARQQERELRAWLYGAERAVATTLAEAIRVVADEVEQAYDVQVEVVAVGDRAIDDRLNELVAAAREAIVNAAKHSGTTQVAVFVESGDREVEVFVRDRGRGFDRSMVADDRRGIAGSIEGRLHRVGGAAAVESVLGSGTEVRLSLPLADEHAGSVVP